jgi:hypothetical protein
MAKKVLEEMPQRLRDTEEYILVLGTDNPKHYLCVSVPPWQKILEETPQSRGGIHFGLGTEHPNLISAPQRLSGKKSIGRVAAEPRRNTFWFKNRAPKSYLCVSVSPWQKKNLNGLVSTQAFR